MWFHSWMDLVRVVVVGLTAYVALVVILRFSGKRTLSKLNAFDLVVTVALGSTLSTILLSKDVSWAEGAVALALLTILQMCVTWISVRSRATRKVVSSTATLLAADGRMLDDAMVQQRVTQSQLLQAVRQSGLGSFADIGAIVLESDGTLSVVPSSKLGDASALNDVPGARGVRRR